MSKRRSRMNKKTNKKWCSGFFEGNTSLARDMKNNLQSQNQQKKKWWFEFMMILLLHHWIGSVWKEIKTDDEIGVLWKNLKTHLIQFRWDENEEPNSLKH